MDIIYLLLPIVLLLVVIIVAVFFWAVKSDQFEDLEGPAYRILMNDDQPASKPKAEDPDTTDASEKKP